MNVLRSRGELDAWRAQQRLPIGFVPTMGALHAGHARLIETSAQLAPITVVSIFVNPLQFGPDEDLSRYPRTEEEDLQVCESRGVAAVYAPSVGDLYSNDRARVVVRDVTTGFEGEQRPGHFEGVATVVLKLFLQVQPYVSVFGWKDLQQCAVISQMVDSLCIPTRLWFVETVREEDGLALSSRNRYLSPEDRVKAARFPQILTGLAGELRANPAQASAAMERANAELVGEGLPPDYLDIVDPMTMKSAPALPGHRVTAAVRLSGIRLLDNLPL